MNKKYPNCDKCKYRVRFRINGEYLDVCNNVGCEMFKDKEEEVNE